MDTENGQNKWEVKSNILFVSPECNIGIGYDLKKTELLQGIDLFNGKIIWDRQISRDYGWNSIIYLNDSEVLITAAGLHTLNLQNGTGWDFDGITGKKDYTGTIAANAAGVAWGLLSGTGVISTGHSLVRDLVSNTLVYDESIFLADRERISCLDFEGNINWMHTFPNDIVSKSKIFVKGDTIYMVNYGYAFMGQRKLNYGVPFIAGFNKNNGEQCFYTETGDKKTQFVDFYWQPDGIFTIIYKDKIAKYSMADGTLVADKSIESNVYGESLRAAEMSMYIKNDGIFASLVLSNPQYTYVVNSNSILEFDEYLNVKSSYKFDQVYSYYLKTDKYRFLSKEQETVVIDENNNEVAKFEATRRAFKIGNKLYVSRDNSIIEIDIADLL